MVGIWEMGILLAGIGLLILCIFAAVTIRDFGMLAKKIDKIIDASQEEIKMISKSTAGIASSIDSISGRVDKIFGILTAFEQLKSIFKKNKPTTAEDVEQGFEEMAEVYYDTDEEKENFESEDCNYKAE